MRGTLLNTATVAVGATIGLLAGRFIPIDYREVALTGLGLVTVGMGIRMFLKTRNALIPAIAVAIGDLVWLRQPRCTQQLLQDVGFVGHDTVAVLAVIVARNVIVTIPLPVYAGHGIQVSFVIASGAEAVAAGTSVTNEAASFAYRASVIVMNERVTVFAEAMR